MAEAPKPLNYETPPRPPPLMFRIERWVEERRRTVFALGVGLVLGGFGYAIESIRLGPSGGGITMFVGGILVALSWPFMRKE